jgi:hypothetical protein
MIMVVCAQNMVENSVGSAPSSPASRRRGSAAGGGAGAHAHSAPGSRGGSALGFSVPRDAHDLARSDGPGSMPLHLTAPIDRR